MPYQVLDKPLKATNVPVYNAQFLARTLVRASNTRFGVTHSEVGEHEVLPVDRKPLQPAQKQGDVAVLTRVDRHVLHALFGRLASPFQYNVISSFLVYVILSL